MFILGGYACVTITARMRSGTLLAGLIAALGFAFAYLKQYTLLEGLTHPEGLFFSVGLSYILFRILQILIDVHGQALREAIPFVRYLNFLFFFLTFVSGPIQRYQDFKAQEDRSADAQPTADAIQSAFNRILTGYIKVVVIAGLLHHLHVTYGYGFAASALHGKVVPAAAWYATAVLIFTLYLYINFSGYMDIVIGIGELMGFDLPENFNRPFLSENFLDFWSRWHMTLSEWFRIYLFNPLLKSMMKRWDHPAASPYLGVIAFFITFFVMGLWHGTTWMFLFYGFFLGFGVSFNKLYQLTMAKWLGKKPYQTLGQMRLYRLLSRGLTMSYFCVSLTCLWMTFPQIQALFGPRFPVVGVAAFLGLGMVLALFFAVWTGISGAIEKVASKVRPAVESLFFRNSWMAGKLIVLYYVILKTSSSVPEFVYKAF